MSELKACCPVCGANDWEHILPEVPELHKIFCPICGTIFTKDNINRRVLSWVRVSERLPKKDGFYAVMAETKTPYSPYFESTSKTWIECPWKVTHWLDDRTDKEEWK